MMRAPFKLFVAFIAVAVSALCAMPAQASLHAQVDRNAIALNESFTLTLQNDDGQSGDPDLSALRRDFEIAGQSKSNSVQIINGRTTQSAQWQISLIAKHAGQLQIPPISIGGESSAAIDIKVSEVSQAQAAQQSGTLFVEVSAEPQSVRVQQQIILTVRLYNAVNLSNGNLSEPSFPNMDAMVQRLGEDRNFQSVRNGQSYSVTERRYAVFPQKSGQFNGDAIIFDGNVIDQNQHNGGFFMFAPFARTSHHVRVRSNTVVLSVKPIPAEFTGSQWLPASGVKLEERWSADPPIFIVGEPITRTLIESADGLTASQLPALAGDAGDGFKTYPDQPQLKDGLEGSGLSGRREQKIAYIATRPGKLMLPAIELKWWNVKLDKEEVATLPAHSFMVLPSKTESASSAAIDRPPETAAPGNGAIGPAVARPVEGASAGWWPWLSLFLGTGWCATLFAWRSRVKGQRGRKSARVGESEQTLKSLERRLKQSCLQNDPVAAKSSLLALARHRWPRNPPVSLMSMARHCTDELAGELALLDRALYADRGTNWQGEKLWVQYAAQQHGRAQEAFDQGAALEPLYFSDVTAER